MMQAARTFTGDTLVVASHNQGKVREINDLLKPLGITARSATELNLPEPAETETTFIGNAKLKALSAATHSGLPSLADDSGLAVDALGGDPGLYSARWAGPGKDFALAMQKVEEGLQQANDDMDRRAHFICALCLAWPDEHCETFEGRVSGTLVWPPRGTQGFGYDPVFQADGYEITFGEMNPEHKHEISHRADAFQQMLAAVFRPNA
ncbi:MAG: RdgB/HAM1 family non-canonical purine NTP pyrophosphatase [Hyphomicrobiales bacterium]